MRYGVWVDQHDRLPGADHCRIVYLVQTINGRNNKTDTNEASLDILKKRYAKGEISKEDFDRMKDDLAKFGRKQKQELGDVEVKPDESSFI